VVSRTWPLLFRTKWMDRRARREVGIEREEGRHFLTDDSSLHRPHSCVEAAVLLLGAADRL